MCLSVSSTTDNVIPPVVTNAAYDRGTRAPVVKDIEVCMSGRVHDDIRAIGSQEVC